MKKHLFFFLLTVGSSFLYAQDYLVQVGVYDQTVPAPLLADLGDKIYYSHDNNDFHRYYIGTYSETDAMAKAKELRKNGRLGVEIADMESFNGKCSCNLIPLPDELPTSLSSIFFDFDKYGIRPDARQRLDNLVATLNANPTYSTRLLGHTDAKGTNNYNDNLSLNRARAAKRYLISQGIAASRIQIENFGELKPIAKNALEDGTDTEEGRQFNRRVELVVLTPTGDELNLVDPIEVPYALLP